MTNAQSETLNPNRIDITEISYETLKGIMGPRVFLCCVVEGYFRIILKVVSNNALHFHSVEREHSHYLILLKVFLIPSRGRCWVEILCKIECSCIVLYRMFILLIKFSERTIASKCQRTLCF